MPVAPQPPLRRSLTLVVGVPLLAAVLGLGAVLGPGASRAVEHTAVALHREAGRRIAAELRPLLDAPHAANEANAELLRTVGALPDEELRLHLFRQLQVAPDVGYLQVGWAVDGGFVGVERGADGFVTELSDAGRTGKGVWSLDATGRLTGPQRAFVAGYDARTRPWYRAAEAARGPTWSPIYQFSSRDRARLGITAVQPWLADGHLVAVLGADLVLAQLTEVLRRADLGEGSAVALVERDGQLVASSRGEPFRVGADGVAERLGAAACGDGVVEAAFAAAAGGDGAVTDLAAEVAVRAGGHYVYATPLADGRGLDWVLLVAVPEAAVVAPLGGELASAALLGLAILVGGVGAAALLAGRIARPLTELAGAARELSRGRFATPLPPATTEETQALVAAFDAMRAELARTLADADTARRSAVDADKAKTTFLHGMSHELRTPLTAILGYTDLLLDEAPDGSSAKLDLERIRTSGRHLLALINDVLDLARVESGRISLAIEEVDTAALARDVADELRALVERSNVLQLELRPGDAVVQADRARLRQVLVNLVGNAAKFTDRGVVRLSVEPGPDGVTIAVEDTGIGFAPELVERLFRPFERAPGVHGREGTGLGLAIVRRLVVALGGELDVRSAPGAGSTFAVRLPRRFPERSETGIPVVRR